MAVLVLGVHEILSHGYAGIRCQVLQRCAVRSGSCHHDGILHGTVVFQSLHHTGNRGGLLAYSHIDADTVLALLVDDGVGGDSRLAGAAVADDQLALSASDRHQGVNSLEAGLERLMDGLAVCNARCLELYRTGLRSLDGAFAVDGTAQGVHHAADHSLAHRHLHDLAGALYGSAFLDFRIAAQDNGTYVVLLKVQDQTIYIIAEIEQLACHSLVQAMDMGDAVTDFDNRTHIIHIQIYVVVLDLVFDDRGYFFRIHFHISLSPQFLSSLPKAKARAA